MKRFFIWISIVIVTVLVIDSLIGIFFSSYVKNQSLPGDYEAIEEILRHNESDLLVLGSSVALNSINTKALEDSLGIKSFNGGGNGQTFPFFLTLLKAAVKTHSPKVVVLCFQPSALTSDGLGNRYNFLAPYYGLGIADIDENINKADRHNRWFMKSTAYKLNTIWFRILLYNFITPNIKGENGHVAKPIPPVFPTKHDALISEFTPEREKQLTEFFEICHQNNIAVMLLFPPEYVNYTNITDSSNVICQTIDLAEKYGVRVYNDIEMAPFKREPDLFYDNAHINVAGTEIYSDTIINRLKEIM